MGLLIKHNVKDTQFLLHVLLCYGPGTQGECHYRPKYSSYATRPQWQSSVGCYSSSNFPKSSHNLCKKKDEKWHIKFKLFTQKKAGNQRTMQKVSWKVMNLSSGERAGSEKCMWPSPRAHALSYQGLSACSIGYSLPYEPPASTDNSSESPFSIRKA